MRKGVKKLKLSRETLVLLNEGNLQQIKGKGGSQGCSGRCSEQIVELPSLCEGC